MLAIPAHCHEGHIQLNTQGLPRDAKVVVLFLDVDAESAPTNLSPEQQAALKLQSQSHFAKDVLLNSAEDCWNDA